MIYAKPLQSRLPSASIGAASMIEASSSSLNLSALVVRTSPRYSFLMVPLPSGSNNLKAERITSSGSVPVSLSANMLRKNGEVDLSWGFGDHTFKDFGVHGVNTEGFESRLEISNIDDTVSVSIDHTEGFLEFLDLRWLKHRENIGSILLLTALLAHFV